jgi:hypothetical protein
VVVAAVSAACRTAASPVAVREGMVTIAGEADRRTDSILVERLAERVDGVVTVRSELTYRHDDGDLPG